MALTRSVPFSVLDGASVAEGSSPGEALRNSIDLAQRAEALGYRRFWVTEHHSMPGVATSAPAVILAHLAAVTDHIRLGSGGVMLPNHAPLVVAEQFGTLEAFAPGRIDLGLGRAPGADQRTAAALGRSLGQGGDDFVPMLAELLAFFDGTFPAGHPYANVHAVPGRGAKPAIWLLGSSGGSAQIAGVLGLPFAFAHHFSPANTLPALEIYRQHFRPSDVLEAPHVMIAAAVTCADTDEEAQWLHGSSKLYTLRLRKGDLGRVPSPAEAAEHRYTPEEQAFLRALTGAHIVGGPDTVTAGLDQLLAATGADEMVIASGGWDYAARRHSYELIAELAGLTPRRLAGADTP
jgi:luciferase family oxidoreductase group 1